MKTEAESRWVWIEIVISIVVIIRKRIPKT